MMAGLELLVCQLTLPFVLQLFLALGDHAVCEIMHDFQQLVLAARCFLETKHPLVLSRKREQPLEDDV
uniref:Putative secreted peptide n=1 Tax=Anopheles braziliensis TaxID=58242 RepID=A0A2M3ZUA0_9DIPT